MTQYFITALIRLALMGGGSAILAKYGFGADDVQAVGKAATSGGSIGADIIGTVAVVVPVIWAHFSNKASALIDKAVTVSGGASSPLAATAPMAKVVAGGKASR